MTSETSTSGRKVAVVTGASSGIGAATAKQFAAEGFRVVLGARREDKLEAVAEEIRAAGGEATVYKVDVTSDDDVVALAKAEPRVDVLVNNAGGAWGMESVEGAVEEKWRWMYDVNVLGTLRVTRALLPALKTTSGIVLTVGSIAGRQVYTGGAGYSAPWWKSCVKRLLSMACASPKSIRGASTPTSHSCVSTATRPRPQRSTTALSR